MKFREVLIRIMVIKSEKHYSIYPDTTKKTCLINGGASRAEILGRHVKTLHGKLTRGKEAHNGKLTNLFIKKL